MNQTRLKSFVRAALGSKTKIALILLMCVGIPSVFLLFLAIRGIKNDEALSEQRLLSDHRRSADSFALEVDHELSRIEQELITLLSDLSASDDSDLIESIAEVRSSRLVDDIFVIRDDDLVYPLARLLYRAGHGRVSRQAQPATVSVMNLISEAERNEFQLHDYTRAGELYGAALNSTKIDDMRADLLMRRARVFARQRNEKRAIETLGVVVEQYGNISLPWGLPAGLAAQLEIVTLLRRTNDNNQALRLLCGLYQELLKGDWGLDESQFRFARSTLESHATDLGQSTLTITSEMVLELEELTDKADSLVVRTDFLLDVSSAALPIILDSSRFEVSTPHRCQRLAIPMDDGPILLLVATASTARQSHIASVGAILDKSHLTMTMLPELIESLSLGRNCTLVIKGSDGVQVCGAEPPAESRLTVRSPFIGGFPPWSIELHQDDPVLFQELLSGRRSFYIYALLLVMIALAFGAIMATRMMSKELELARLKSDFVSTVSHEFRSPLTAIRQMTEMLQSGRIPSDARRQEYYDAILTQSERLSLLVSNTLDLARIDEGRLSLDYEVINVHEFLEGIVARASQPGGSQPIPITLRTEGDLPIVYADPGAITRVLSNLIDNAIKYSRESPQVSVSAHVDGNDVVISVKDQGIGIPKSEIERVFERFYRGGDELTRRQKGSGLGLSLVQDVVRSHGGTVSVMSEVGKGSVFTVRLPITRT